MVLDHLSANGLVSASACFASASWLDWISNMSLIATLFTKSCADGVLVPAGGVWARATEANRPQPTVISSDLFMICTPGSCGSRAAQLTNLAVPFWFRGVGR
jgi:hypothetical protein